MKNALNPDGSSLVESIRTGDADAFEELFREFAEPLLDFALSYVKDPPAAEDIVQDVFVKVWSGRENLKPSLSVKSYLYKSVRNNIFKHIRHENVRRMSEEIIVASYESVKRPDEELNEKEFAVSIGKSIEELPEKCREIFMMNRFDRLTYNEIAEVLNISVNTVKTQMGRAFKFLRMRLSQFLAVFPM